MPAENPGGGEIDDEDPVVLIEQNVSMVEVSKGHTVFVDRVHLRSQSIKDSVIESRTHSLAQRYGIDPMGGESMSTHAAKKRRQRLGPSSRLVRRRLATDQPPTEGVSDQKVTGPVCLDRHPDMAKVKEQHVCLGPVSPYNPAFRLVLLETFELRHIPIARV